MMDEPHDKEAYAKRKMMVEAMVKAEEDKRRRKVDGTPVSNPNQTPIRRPVQTIGVRG